MKRIYVCHPFSDDPEGNRAKVLRICKYLAGQGHLPIAPHLYLPQFVDEATQRDLAMKMCHALLTLCNVIVVCGGTVSPGMAKEIRYAESLGIEFQYIVRLPVRGGVGRL